MVDKIFKMGMLIASIIFLIFFYFAVQKDRYQVITDYDGYMGIFDSRKGVVYMLEMDTDQWTVIKPFTPSQSI